MREASGFKAVDCLTTIRLLLRTFAPHDMYLLTSVKFFFFLGTVALVVIYLCTLLRSGHVCWTLNHDELVVNGNLAFPDSTSDTVISPILAVLISSTYLHIEQSGDVHVMGLRDAKSENVLDSPDMCRISTEYCAAMDKYVVTFGLALNCPRRSFLYAKTQGLESVNTLVRFAD